jgi:PIN domain nuclease of toxin-antitoxin system
VRLLADTQAFLWFVAGDSRLSPRARRSLEDADAEWYVSAASVWEIAIKAGNGRLALPAATHDYLAEKVSAGLKILSVDWPHAAAVEALPGHHRDPFDRLIVAQAQVERLTIVTSDPVFDRYGVPVLW